MKFRTTKWFQISCRRGVTNGETETWNVRHTLFDRLLGVSFEQKVLEVTEEFYQEIKGRNEDILRLREKAESLAHTIQNRY